MIVSPRNLFSEARGGWKVEACREPDWGASFTSAKPWLRSAGEPKCVLGFLSFSRQVDRSVCCQPLGDV